MTVSGMYQVVDAPAAPAPRGTALLRNANLVPEDDPHWMNGLTWRPRICGDSHRAAAILACGSAWSGFAPLHRPDNPDYVPPSVTVGVPCSAISGEALLQETKNEAATLLDRCETLGIARELWRGDVAIGENPDLPNDYLSKSTTLVQLNGGASTHAIDALAWLEAELAAASCAGGSVIHCSPYTATVWKALHLVEVAGGGKLVTGLGSIVVADPGYDGSAPGGAVDATNATAWAYGTGMVDVRRGPVKFLPEGSDLSSGLNRLNNDFDVYAYRPFAATFDPCNHVGVKVDHLTRT